MGLVAGAIRIASAVALVIAGGAAAFAQAGPNVSGPLIGSPHVLAHPAIVNLFLATPWDAQSPTLGQRDLSRAAVDALTLALANGRYFDDLAQYGVSKPLFARSFETDAVCTLKEPADESAIDDAVRCNLARDPLRSFLARLTAAGLDPALVAFVAPNRTLTRGGQACPDIGPGFHHSVDGTFLAMIGTGDLCRQIAGALVHELAEMFTDPDTDMMSGFVRRTGPLGLDPSALQTGEVGDICQAAPSDLQPFLLNVLVELYWSNAVRGCVPRWPVSAPSLSSASLVQSSTGTIVTVRGTGLGDVAAALGRRAFAPAGRQGFPMNAALFPYAEVVAQHADGTAGQPAGNLFDPGDVPLDVLGWTPTQVQLQVHPAFLEPCDTYAVTLWHPDDGTTVTATAQPGRPREMIPSGFPDSRFPLLVNPQTPFVVHGSVAFRAGTAALVRDTVPVVVTIADADRGTTTRTRRWANGGTLPIPVTIYQTLGPITVTVTLRCGGTPSRLTIPIRIAPRPTHTVPPPSPGPTFPPR